MLALALTYRHRKQGLAAYVEQYSDFPTSAGVVARFPALRDCRLPNVSFTKDFNCGCQGEDAMCFWVYQVAAIASPTLPAACGLQLKSDMKEAKILPRGQKKISDWD